MKYRKLRIAWSVFWGIACVLLIVWGLFWFNPWGVDISVPYSFLILLTSMVAVSPWFLWRFSLRTLLIVTTLVAVGLGAIVYAVR